MNWEDISDKISQWSGGFQFFVGFTVGSIIWTILGMLGIDAQFGALTLFLSVLAIWLLIFLQNSQNREQAQFRRWLQEDVKNTKEVLELLHKLDNQTRKD
jgi:low affinity Fe/Cu permease